MNTAQTPAQTTLPTIIDKEKDGTMSQEISRLSEGQIFKSWRDIFSYLHIYLPKGGKIRELAIDHLRQWVAIEDVPNSNKKIIAEVYTEPHMLLDGRSEGNHNLYKLYLKTILLSIFLESDVFDRNYTYMQFWKEMGMCNLYYSDKEARKKLLKADTTITEDQMDEFFSRSWSIMKSITDSVLDSLQNEGMLEYGKSKMIVEHPNTPARLATKEERHIIGSAETRAMHRLGFKNKKDMFLHRKTKECHKIALKILHEEYEWENYFDCFSVIAYKKDILAKGLEQNIKELEKEVQRQEAKQQLNSNVIRRIKDNAQKTNDREVQRIQEMYQEYLATWIGTPWTYNQYFETKAYHLFREDYVAIQDLLTDCFIGDPKILLDKIRSIELDTKETV